MKNERKLAECFEALTIDERVDAMLRAWKSGAPEDPLLRRNVPREQRSELATLLAHVRAVCGDLGPVAVELGQATTELATRLAWLQTMEGWAGSSRMLAEALLVLVPEPLTKTEHARRLAELRNEPLTSDEALDIVCEHRGCDLSEAASLLDGAVRDGQLDSSGEGKRVAVLSGDLHKWLKVPLEVVPDWGLEVEVFADSEEKQVLWRRNVLNTAREALRRAPVWPVPDESDSFQNDASRTARTLMEKLVSDLGSNWQQLGAMDACLQKIRSHFGDEDPVLPMVREILDGAREGMLTVAAGLEEMGFAVALDEPPDDLVDLYGEVVDSAVAEELARHDA